MQFVETSRFLEESSKFPVIDVRSPNEFALGHIPCSINLPLFSDRERAEIGTIYTREGRDPAVQKGLEITGPKMAEFALNASKIAVQKKALVHCWRGGMRSESMAWLYERIGIECFVLKGGYKAYRNYLFTQISEIENLIIILGPTGCGKTEILQQLNLLGEQVLDLEELACHKGSVFGGIGLGHQPTTQQFQNNLFGELRKLDRKKRIFIEGESQSIGKIFIPDQFWSKMMGSQAIVVNVPREERIRRLVREYGRLALPEMELAIKSLVKRLGEVHMNEILSDYQSGKISQSADQLLNYYDKTYRNSTLDYKNRILEIEFPTGNAAENAVFLLNRLNKMNKND